MCNSLLMKSDTSDWNETAMEEMVSKELEAGISEIARIIPKTSKLIAPLMNVANNEKSLKGNINLKQVPLYPDVLWKSDISVNGRTSEFHAENNSTYDVISTPEQEQRSKSKYEYVYLFKAKDKHNISIRLAEVIYFHTQASY